jgi:hypothetical protein
MRQKFSAPSSVRKDVVVDGAEGTNVVHTEYRFLLARHCAKLVGVDQVVAHRLRSWLAGGFLCI